MKKMIIAIFVLALASCSISKGTKKVFELKAPEIKLAEKEKKKIN